MIKVISLCVDEDKFSSVEVKEFDCLEVMVLWDWFGCMFDCYMGKLLGVNERKSESVDDLIEKMEECYEDESVKDWFKSKKEFRKLVRENDGWKIWGVWNVEYDCNVSVVVCDEWDKKKLLDGKVLEDVMGYVGEMKDKVWERLYGGGR